MRHALALVPHAGLPLLFLLAACGSSSGPSGPALDGGAAPDGGSSPDAGLTPDGGLACPRTPAPADRARQVVISHPFDDQGQPARRFELLDLSASGTLTFPEPRVFFEMGRVTEGDFVFTANGEIGLVAQEDGSIGVFRARATGPEVVHAAFQGSFYASALRLPPGGEEVLVLDANFPENGGGLYRVRLGCDGALTDLGRSTAGKLLRGLVPIPGGGRWAAAARQLLGSPAGDDLHLLTLGPEPARVGGVDAFGDDEAIVSALAVTGDGRHLLVGDNNAFSGIPNRIAVAAVTAGGLSRVQTLSPVQDPVAIAVSPFGNAVLVASGFGNALLRLSYDPQSRTPFMNRGALSYQGNRPALPANLAPLERGALTGRVLVAENLGVRQVQFETGGTIRDLGLTSTGRGGAAVVGIVGVQP
jgi:hypothetical protein